MASEGVELRWVAVGSVIDMAQSEQDALLLQAYREMRDVWKASAGSAPAEIEALVFAIQGGLTTLSHGCEARVKDPRWESPMPVASLGQAHAIGEALALGRDVSSAPRCRPKSM